MRRFIQAQREFVLCEGKVYYSLDGCCHLYFVVGESSMSEQNFSQKDSPKGSSFGSINWISLWQATGNDWSWMVKPSGLSNARLSVQKKEALNQRKIILIEIFLTIALLLLARYVESSQQFVLHPSQRTNFFESTILQVDPNSNND